MNNYTFVLAVLITLAIFFACGNKAENPKKQENKGTQETIKNDWPQTEIDGFLTNCRKNAEKNVSKEKAIKYCDCSLNEVLRKFPNYKDAGNITAKDIADIAKKCEESDR